MKKGYSQKTITLLFYGASGRIRMRLRRINLLLGPNPAPTKKTGTGDSEPPVPATFLWRARQDSNLRPTDS